MSRRYSHSENPPTSRTATSVSRLSDRRDPLPPPSLSRSDVSRIRPSPLDHAMTRKNMETLARDLEDPASQDVSQRPASIPLRMIEPTKRDPSLRPPSGTSLYSTPTSYLPNTVAPRNSDRSASKKSFIPPTYIFPNADAYRKEGYTRVRNSDKKDVWPRETIEEGNDGWDKEVDEFVIIRKHHGKRHSK